MKTISALIVSFALTLTNAGFAGAAVPVGLEQVPMPTEPADDKTSAALVNEETPTPLSKDEQEKLAKAMLSKGICNVAFYGEDFCAKQVVKSFKVTDQFGNGSDQNVSVEDHSNH